MGNARHTASSRQPNWFDGELDGASAADAGSALRYRHGHPSTSERSRRDLDDLIAEGQMWG